ncbi:hypothetical protein BV22DRAFT_856462 [Leucogyrophana mollusca]|uniref:Uncharacterized protein n=1 Tax=Leucogyrophana mollusca TaxID=85980 RepID=A0ACB8B2T3_9AGAM|nr:hypothetical protein BV22DRAFT_856462 [Leucogyrophana mollusca]
MTTRASAMLSMHMGCLTADLWFVAITAYDDLGALETIPTSMEIAAGISTLLPFLVRCFFIYRLWRISHLRIGVAFPQTVSTSGSLSTCQHPFPLFIQWGRPERQQNPIAVGRGRGA